MVSPKRVSNQAFRLKKPEQPCETAKFLIPQVEAIDERVTNLEMIVHTRLAELTRSVNNLAARIEARGLTNV